MAEYVKHTGGSAVGKTRKPYDAMVYKDADTGYTVAVDANGNVIKKVLSSANTDNIAFQAAFNYMDSKAESTINGCKLHIGTGTYNLANGFTITYPHTIVGNGPSQTILKATADMTMFNVNPTGSSWEYCRITMRDLTLHGDNVASYGVTFGPADSNNLRVVFSIFENMVIRSFKTWGVVNNCNWGSTYRSVFVKSNGDGSGNPEDTGGLKLTGSSGDGHVNCIFCGFDWNATAINITGNSTTSNNKFYGCVIEGNKYHGIYVTQIASVAVRDCWFESNARYNQSHTPIELYDIYGNGSSTIIIIDGGVVSGSYVTKSIYSTGTLRILNSPTSSTMYNGLFNSIPAPSSIKSFNSYTDTVGLSDEFLDGDNWTTTGWTGSWDTGFTHITGNTNTLTHDHTPVVDTYYYITFTVSNRTAGSFNVSFGGVSIPYNIYYSYIFGVKAETTSPLIITPTSDFNGTISNISVRTVVTQLSPALTIYTSTGTSAIQFYSSAQGIIIGNGAGRYSAGGNTNTFIGASSGERNLGGYGNTYVGYETGRYGAFAYHNVFVGTQAGRNNIRGYENVMIGTIVGSSSTFGRANVYIGQYSAGSTTSSNNTFVGYRSGSSITTNGTNTFLGASAGYNSNQLTTATNSMGLGYGTFTTRNNQVVIGNHNIVETQLRAKVYIGSTSTTDHTQPTAKLHIAAGSASASTAPIKLTSGTLMTNPEAGAIEFDGSNLYITISSTRYKLVKATDRNIGTGATVTSGNTYVDVTHSLSTTPTSVRVTPTSNLGTRSFWVSDKGASTFRININSSDVIDHIFDWEAEV